MTGEIEGAVRTHKATLTYDDGFKCKNRLRSYLSVVLTFFLSAWPSFACSQEAICRNEWSIYVSEVVRILGSNKLAEPLLFVARDGEVYDCLELAADDNLLKEAQIYEESLPLDRTGPLLLDPMTWPPNICTVGSARWPGIQYSAISLPTDPAILATKACQKRVFRGIERLVDKLGEE